MLLRHGRKLAIGACQHGFRPLPIAFTPAKRRRQPRGPASAPNLDYGKQHLMSDTVDTTLNGADNLPQIGLIAQYVKDLSFENPNSPAVYQWQGQPGIDVQFNIASQPAADDVFEVTLKVTATATAEQGTAFAAELVYAGLFGMRNVPAEQMQPFLFAEAPRLLFPFARRVLADTVQDGGFPPLLLDPIDFGALYMQQAAAQANGINEVSVTGNA
jgi:preprotein translocase subunit SecB